MAYSPTTQTSPSSSSSSLPPWEVFLSFHGKDTRNSFTAHLYAAFKQRGLSTFRDDKELERGKYISQELLNAIENSMYAVVVLSPNYAFSRWCLIELAKIIECMKKKRLIILPVFYHMNPSDVRNQKGTFAYAFAKHENEPDLERWRSAVQEVGHISGWVLHDGDESKAIRDIVGKILSKLNALVSTSSVSKDLIGIASRVEELEYLCLNNRPDDDVHFVGIWGMGGIGKTTLASAFYYRFYSQFVASSFIVNVRERTGKDGLISLQKQLLSDILMERNIDVKDVDRGKNTIRLRLRYKKVLVILDDVDQSEQLEALANERNWFGPGSSIIITTRDERLLIEHGLTKNEIYKAQELNNDEALQLFSWKAFKQELPPEDFVGLSKQIIHYAKRHPLALRVLGSFLFERSVDFWESAVRRLKENPDRKIMKTLKISFDGLEEKEQNIFLDIACFYKGKDSYRVKSILESCGYHPNVGIEVLISKSLITMSGRKLWMHDLLEDMGREIVRRESPEDPGGRSRLWHDEDILRVLKSNSGTKRIQGIVLNSPPQEDQLHLNIDVFSNMKNLRLLKIIGNVHLSQGLSYLSTELRDMEWHGYPSKSWPPGFPPDKLVELSMCSSHIVQPWQGIKSLSKLKLVDLSDSRDFKETPDFTGAPNLQRLILQGCTKLLKLHSSVGDLRRLIVLNLKDCASLRSLPCNISSDSLQELILSGCSRLEKLPESVGNLKRLSQLRLDGCSKLDKMPEDLGNVEDLEELDISGTAIRQVPSSFLRLQNLKMLNCQGCPGLPPQSLLGLLSRYFLPSSDIGFVLPDSFSGLRCLNKLNLSFCGLKDGAIPSDLSGLSSLLALDLSGNDFTLLPDSISQLSKLRVLFLRSCSRLRLLPELPSSIVNVAAEDCISLKEYSNEISGIIPDDAGLAHHDLNKNGPALVVTGKPPRQSKHSIMSGRYSVPAAQGNLIHERTIKAHMDLARVIPGGSRGSVGIPTWFQNRRMGSSITIRLQQDMDDSRKWLGCALYFVFEIYDLESWESTDQEDYEQLVFHFVTDEGPLKEPLEQIFHKYPVDTPAGYWIYVPRIWFEERSNHEVDTLSYIEVSITIDSRFVKVEMCGARLVYEQNAQEFIDAILSSEKMTLKICDGKGHFKFQSNPYPSGSLLSFLVQFLPQNVGEVESSGSNLLDKGFTSNEMLECTSENSISSTSNIPRSAETQSYIDSTDSTISLKTDLQSLLLRCYEVNYAKSNMHKYVFPLSASPLWFTRHGKIGMGPVVSVDLPPNLYDDKGWVGFAVCVSYVIRDQTSVSRNIFGHLDAYDDDLECFLVFPPTPDTIVAGPSKLFLFHIPCDFFTDKLNQRSKIRASFGTDNQNMEVVMCGIRLVFEQDLIGLVHTIVDCVLRSPDSHHQSYLRSFGNQVNNLPNYVCEAVSSECNPILPGEMPCSFGYFSTERRNQFSEKLQSNSEEQNYHLFEKCLTQIIFGRDSKDSNSKVIKAGAAYLNELSKGDPVKASLVKLVLNHFQDTHINRFHPYNNCFLQCEIPEYFCCHGGSSVTFQLVENLNNNSDWMGISLCAVFTVNKNNQPLIHDNDPVGSEISYVLACNLTSNTGLGTQVSHKIDTMSGNNSFIWVSYIPRASFSESLNECDHLRASFYSSSQELILQKFGHQLVYLNNMAELVGTIAQCAATCRIDDQEETNISDSSDDELSTRTRIKETSGNHLSILNQKIGKCMKFLQNPRKEFHFFFECDYCFPPISEIPYFLTYQGKGPSVTIERNDSEWEGLLICASFTFQENQVEFLESMESEIPHLLTCFLDTGTDRLRPMIHVYRTKQEFKWLHLHGFVWLFYIPIGSLPDRIKHYNRMKVSIMSDWPVWTVNNCGLRFLSTQDLEEFMHLLLHFQVSFFDNWGHFHREIVEQDCILSNETDQGCASMDSGFASNVESHPTSAENQAYILDTSTIFLKRKFETLFSTLFEGLQNDYHGYFFPKGEIPPWFSNRNDGPSIEIQLPPNLYNNESWMGFAVCAVLSCPAGSPAGCILHLDSNEGCLKPDLVLRIYRYGLLNSNQLLVVHYVSPTILPNKLNQWSHVKAIVKCNIPSVETQMCGIRLMYRQDVEGFVQTTAECAVATLNNQYGYYYQSYVEILDFLKTRGNRTKFRERNFYAGRSPVIERRFQSLAAPPSICKHEGHQQCSSSKTFSNGRVSNNTALGNGVEIVLPPGYLDCTSDSVFSLKTDFEYFLRNGVTAFNLYATSCFSTAFLPQTKVPEWFNHQSKGAFVNIQLPPNVMNDRNWMGLALCATFSIHDDQHSTYLSRENPALTCILDTDLGGLMPLPILHLTKEKCMWFYLRGFLWLVYIPHGSLIDRLCSPCSQIKASFGSDCPNLTVQNCSLRLLYCRDMEEFEQTYLKCFTPPYQYQNREVFHRNFEYSSCFLPCGITEWFSYHNNEPSVGFELPPDFYNDSNWLGLAMCASFCVYEDDKAAHVKMLDLGNPHYLLCLLDTDIGSVEPDLHSHRPFTEEEIKLVHQGEIMWISFIPKGSLPEWLNQCTRIEASIASDCPSLRVHKCGFRLLYQHDEVEFKETIRHCNKQNCHRDETTSVTRPNFDPTLQDKGKRVVQ